MKRMRYAILFILILTLGFSLSSCKKDKEESLQSKIDLKSTAYISDLEDSLQSFVSNEAIAKYIVNWADSKSVTNTVDKHGNIIMNIPSSEQYIKAPPTVIVTTYDYKNITQNINQIATALSVIKNNENTGELTVIFTPSDGNDFYGIKELSSKYFPDNAKVFCLNSGLKQRWSFSTAAMSAYKITGQGNFSQPTGTTSFKVEIKGLPGGTPDGKISSYPNPIREFTSILAYFKTNAIIYELADFSGGNSGNLYPQNATMTLVVSDNYVDKLVGKLDKEIKKFTEKYQEEYPNATFEYTQLPTLPSLTLSKESLNQFISAQYTLLNGVYNRDLDDEPNGVTNIGYISLSPEGYTCLASAFSMTDKGLEQIDNDYATICSLAGLNYTKLYSFPSWSVDQKNSFADEITKAFKEYTGYDMEYKNVVEETNASFISQKNPKCSIVDVSFGKEKIERYAGTIVTFLKNQNHEKENKLLNTNQDKKQ